MMRGRLQTIRPLLYFMCSVFLVVGAAVLTYGLAGREKVGFTLRKAAYSAKFTPDSRHIVTGGFDETSLLDIEAHKLVDRFPRDDDALPKGVEAGEFKTFAVSADGKYVASGGGLWRPVRVLDFRTGRVLRSFDTNRTDVLALALSPDGRWLAAGTAYRLHAPHGRLYGLDLIYEAVYEIWLWDLSQGGNEPIRILGHEAPVDAIAFLPDGRRMISLSDVSILRLWDITTRHELKRSGTWEPPAGMRATESGSRFEARDSRARGLVGNALNDRWSMTLSSDGKHVVCGRTVWGTEDLKIECFADGQRLSRDFDEWQRINLKQPYSSDDKQRKMLHWFAYGYRGALTPDNRRLVIAGPFGLHQTFSEGLLTPRGKELLAMKTPNGQQVLTGSESQFSVFDVKTGDLLFSDQVFSNGASVFALDVSPDGRYALAAGSGGTAGSGGAPVRRDPGQLYLYRLPP